MDTMISELLWWISATGNAEDEDEEDNDEEETSFSRGFQA